MGTFQDPRCEVDTDSAVDSSSIKVLVGPEKRAFYIHEKYLRSSSAFFEAALRQRWQKQDTERTVELPEDDATSFGRFVHWLYNGKIASKLPTGRTDNTTLIKLYILGEKLLANAFQDRVLDAIVAGTRIFCDNAESQGRWYPTKSNVGIAYRGTPRGSPLRRLMVDMHVVEGERHWIDEEQPDNNNHEFLVDLAAAALDKLDRYSIKNAYGELYAGSPCSYHKHGKDEPCPSKGA